MSQDVVVYTLIAMNLLKIQNENYFVEFGPPNHILVLHKSVFSGLSVCA